MQLPTDTAEQSTEDSLTSMGTAPHARGAIIRGVDISKRYVMGKDNYVDALQDASVEIREGEMVGIMGPSGSGKSTLLHILGCLDSADTGRGVARRPAGRQPERPGPGRAAAE